MKQATTSSSLTPAHKRRTIPLPSSVYCALDGERAVILENGLLFGIHVLAANGKKGNAAMPNGTVKWFDKQKQYGFIGKDGGGKDTFVHITAVEAAGWQTLTEGQKIHYDVVEKKGRKPYATNLAARID